MILVSSYSPSKYDEYNDDARNLQEYNRYASNGSISEQNIL